jgi:hypothetical protein
VAECDHQAIVGKLNIVQGQAGQLAAPKCAGETHEQNRPVAHP